MRILGAVLALTFFFSGVSLAGSTDNLPGIGTFAYNGSPVSVSAQ